MKGNRTTKPILCPCTIHGTWLASMCLMKKYVTIADTGTGSDSRIGACRNSCNKKYKVIKVNILL